MMMTETGIENETVTGLETSTVMTGSATTGVETLIEMKDETTVAGRARGNVRTATVFQLLHPELLSQSRKTFLLHPLKMKK
jgi:hypothetical protein